MTAALAKRMGCEKVIARVHHRAYVNQKSFNYCSKFDIDHLICPEQLTSRAITSNLSDPGVMEIKYFAANQIEMHKYVVKSNSPALGVKLKNLQLPPQMRIAVVERKGSYFIVDGETAFEIDDKVTVIGKEKGFKDIQTFFQKSKNNQMVAVLGGTSMGEWLAEDLYTKHFATRLFEPKRNIAREISERFPNITVIASDPTDPNEFEAEHLERCAAFITATDNDEHNLLGALQAKKLGVPVTCAVIHKPHYLPVLENVGIDYPMSPRVVAAENLLNFIEESGVRVLANLAPKVADVYEVGPVTGGDGVGKQLKSIELPKATLIAAVQRNGDACVPKAEDSIEKGDLLIVLGPHHIRKTLRRMFLS